MRTPEDDTIGHLEGDNLDILYYICVSSIDRYRRVIKNLHHPDEHTVLLLALISLSIFDNKFQLYRVSRAVNSIAMIHLVW